MSALTRSGEPDGRRADVPAQCAGEASTGHPRKGAPGLRVLAVCDRAPGTGNKSDGDTLISREVLLRLAEKCRLTLAWYQEAHLQPDPEILRSCHGVLPLELATRVVAARGVLSATPMSVLRRSGAGSVRALRAVSEHVDVVYLHGPGTLGLAGRVSGPVVANEIDPMSLVFDDLANIASGPRRIAWALRRRSARAVEQTCRAAAEEYVLVNPEDAVELGRILGGPIRAVPNGVISNGQRLGPATDGHTICFVGALDYPPNIESATMLVRDVLPIVLQHVPQANVVLAGRSAGEVVKALAGKHVTVSSDVPDVMVTYASSAVAAFPGGQGRGTRNSVLEALRAGVPVVASHISARGVGRGPHVRMADSAPEVASSIIELLTQPHAYALSRQAAETYGARLPTWDTVADQYLALLESVAAAPRHGASASRGMNDVD